MYNVQDQSGRAVLVTGANSGTGKEAATRLAGAGATVIMAVRSVEKGEAARASILEKHPGADVSVRRLDLADLSSVREFAASAIGDGIRIDTLVNNAGVMAPPQRIETVDGFELQFGSNFLGPFALTNLLLPRILESEAPRVVFMSSLVANFGRIRFRDLQWEHGYTPYGAYAQSKLADFLAGRYLATAATSSGSKLLSTIAHPGVTRTNLMKNGAKLRRSGPPRKTFTGTGPFGMQSVEQGAEPLLYAATSSGAEQGAYYGPRDRFGLVGPTKKTAAPRSTKGPDLADSLWAVAEDLTGTALPDALR